MSVDEDDESNFEKPQFAGDCMGVDLTDRGDGHIMVVVCIHDDGLWHRTSLDTSSFWLDELIEQLTEARRYIRTQTPDVSKLDGQQYGYRFKAKKSVSVSRALRRSKPKCARCGHGIGSHTKKGCGGRDGCPCTGFKKEIT